MVRTRFASAKDMAGYISSNFNVFLAPFSVSVILVASSLTWTFSLTCSIPFLIDKGYIVAATLSFILINFFAYCCIYFYYKSVFTDPGTAPSQEEFVKLSKTDISTYPTCPKCLFLSYYPLFNV